MTAKNVSYGAKKDPCKRIEKRHTTSRPCPVDTGGTLRPDHRRMYLCRRWWQVSLLLGIWIHG